MPVPFLCQLEDFVTISLTKTIRSRCQPESGEWGHYIASVLSLDILYGPEAELQEKVAGSGICAFVLLVACTIVWDSPDYFSLFLFNCRICFPEGILPYCLSQSFSSLLFSQVSFCESDNSVIIIPPPHSSARESAHLMAWVGIAGVQSTAIFSLYVIMKFTKSLPTSNKPLLHMRSIAK